jgi:hypothetical protein
MIQAWCDVSSRLSFAAWRPKGIIRQGEDAETNKLIDCNHKIIFTVKISFGHSLLAELQNQI